MGKDKDKDVKLTLKEKWQFASTPRNSPLFDKSRADWKAAKDAEKKGGK